MSVIRWPISMPEGGRLSQAKRAWSEGVAKVCDPKMDCPQTLHISLFFDGTNNNDAPDNTHRDSNGQSQTNVARLYAVASNLPEKGTFAFYMNGVGTPFPQIGEDEYSTMGKGFAAGYAMRVAWGYTRVLNAIYTAITRRVLFLDAAAHETSRALTGDKSAVNSLPTWQAALKAAHKQARDESRRNRTIRKVWINVFGFSRGAAEARSFVSRLINIWAPGGKIAGEFDYTVNFLGLFDIVASVGPPDSTRIAIPLKMLDGHWEWTSSGQLNVPSSARRCVHFFSVFSAFERAVERFEVPYLFIQHKNHKSIDSGADPWNPCASYSFSILWSFAVNNPTNAVVLRIQNESRYRGFQYLTIRKS